MTERGERFNWNPGDIEIQASPASEPDPETRSRLRATLGPTAASMTDEEIDRIIAAARGPAAS